MHYEGFVSRIFVLLEKSTMNYEGLFSMIFGLLEKGNMNYEGWFARIFVLFEKIRTVYGQDFMFDGKAEMVSCTMNVTYKGKPYNFVLKNGILIFFEINYPRIVSKQKKNVKVSATFRLRRAKQ